MGAAKWDELNTVSPSYALIKERNLEKNLE